ncbi:MAG: LysM domain-containing protein [Herbinix sp.]|nr:LysM domain-containing protein [Herbinix sp.]
MIESVYSNDNADANRTDMVHTDFRMPKNIRQIGKSNNSKKIYVEDYVMTFTKQLPGEDYSACRVAVLVGQYVKLEEGRGLFISGAVMVDGMDLTDGIVFTNDHWTAIYEKIKKYFVEAEIVGWFIGGPGYLLEDKDKILKAHIDNFAGQDKTLLTFDNMEKEETFYLYENGSLAKQEGFYIYYEKNEEMQNYMIESRSEPSGEEHYDDRVSREIRTILQNKKPADEHKSISYLMYAAGTLLAVIILVVGAAMLNNYDQMKNMKDTLDSLSNNIKEVESVFIKNENSKVTLDTSAELKTDIPVNADGSLNVEVVPGGVSPLPEKDYEDKVNDDEPIDSTNIQPNDNEDDDSHDIETSGQVSTSDAQAEVKYYTVEAGDSLAGISNRLYSSANYISVIKKLNNIEDEDMIYIGQKLILP